MGFFFFFEVLALAGCCYVSAWVSVGGHCCAEFTQSNSKRQVLAALKERQICHYLKICPIAVERAADAALTHLTNFFFLIDSNCLP